MSEPREVPSEFIRQQTAIDYSRLRNCLNILPCNVDGLTEREVWEGGVKRHSFLVFELKHGEDFSIGQDRMLRAWAASPDFLILIINCIPSKPNEKNARVFTPHNFQVMAADGTLGAEHTTNWKAFAVRYAVWTRTPRDGARPFTCSAGEFQETYLRLLPGDEQEGALAALKSETEILL